MASRSMPIRILFIHNKDHSNFMLPHFPLRARLLPLLFLMTAGATRAQTPVPLPEAPKETPPAAASTASEEGAGTLTLFPHPERTRYLLAGQTNIVFQAHGPFHAPYSGPNSLLGRGEYKTSLIGTVYTGFQVLANPNHALDAILDFESAGGRGISEALGLAGFTNLDVVRNPNLGSKPYIARVQLHQTIGLSKELVEITRTPFSLATEAPARRIELHIGKMTLPDFFDLNAIGTDSHLQFLNWTTDNNGAWDYAADTRGYTYAAVAEYIDRAWSARYSVALMPTIPNGIDLDWSLKRASGQNGELELRRNLLGPLVKPERKGTLRLLTFVNHAHMGLYRDAIKAYQAGTDTAPNVNAHAVFSSVKYGFGGNFEQELTPDLRVFGRFGWNEGQHQSFAYTEVDQTVELGGDQTGRPWHRPYDKAGLAFISNAIGRDHQNYLKLGGLGFLLGDGRLNYAREDLLESYYNLHAWKGVFYALDLQFIDHPGYNQDRGPVLVETVRMHVDF